LILQTQCNIQIKINYQTRNYVNNKRIKLKNNLITKTYNYLNITKKKIIVKCAIAIQGAEPMSEFIL